MCVESRTTVWRNLVPGQDQSVDKSGEGEWGINWEIRLDIYTLLCVKRIASGKLLWSTGSSAQCSVMTQRHEMGEGGRSKRDGIYS